MLKKSFSNILKQPKKELDEMPLVAALTMEKLEEDEKIDVRTQTPLICKFCGGILVDYSKLEIKNDIYKWNCEFCGNSNKIQIKSVEEQKEIEQKKELTAEELSLLFQKIIKDTKDEDIGVVSQTKSDALVSVIDISGSMSGGRLASVKHSLIQTVKSTKVNHPETIFSLITFTDFVEVYSTPSKSFKLESDDELFSKKHLRKSMEKKLKHIKIGPLSEFADEWVRKINSLRTIGWTALGPGLFAAQVLIEEKIIHDRKIGARILLLTDGLANQGMGNVEKRSKEDKKFYKILGEECLKSGIIIDLVGVQAGNQVALDKVGVITDITGGEMILISQDQIESTFEQLRRKKYIAKNTVLRVFMPDFLELEGISGTHLSGDIPKKSGQEINLGALDKDREIYLRFKQKKAAKVKKAPIQIQMEYLDANNNKKVRVIRSSVSTTDNVEDYSKGYDAEIFANMEIQEANEHMKNFEMEKASSKLKKLKRSLSSEAYTMTANIGMAQEMADFEEEDWKNMEMEAEEDNVRDMQSYWAMAGQSKSRQSISSRKKLMKKKK